jgi:2-polyprenyl-6-methoxyphenol hydroxylase-like FAD-dependent oxidoreductase
LVRTARGGLYNGHPLEYFTGDKQPGDVTGQDPNSFGAVWYVLSPNGSKLGQARAPRPAGLPAPSATGTICAGYRVKALIAGAGIAGLATGIALRQAGHEVEIFERSSELSEIGAGLMIWPNGTRSLEAIAVEIQGLTVHHMSIRSWRGRRVSELPIDAIAKRHRSEVTFVHRADLQTALARRFGRDGLHLGAHISSFQDDGAHVAVTMRDGIAASGDFLVGADGLRSVVRRQLLGDGDPVYLGSTVWRGVVGSEGIPLQSGGGVNWMGHGGEFLAFHLGGERIYWAGVTKEPRGEAPGPRGHKGDLLQRFGGWAEPVPALIAATEDSAILRNDMYDRPPARRWSRGRVTLVGDAAHPMAPNAGQGACQALEDAVAVAESVGRAPDVAAALELYERRRVRRANRVVTMSRQGSRSVQIENPLLCALRDGLGRLVPSAMLLRLMDSTLAKDP